jgi:3-hydroxyacyl-CoA dehydrogenase
MENKWLCKTGQGFKKRKKILTLDLDTLEYSTAKRASLQNFRINKNN